MYKRLTKFWSLMLLSIILGIGSVVSSPLSANNSSTHTNTQQYEKKFKKLHLKNKNVKQIKKTLKKNPTFKKATIKVTDSKTNLLPSVASLHVNSAKVSTEKFKLDKQGKLKVIYLVTKISPAKVKLAVVASESAESSSKQAAAESSSRYAASQSASIAASESEAASISASVAASESQQAAISASESEQAAISSQAQQAAATPSQETAVTTGGYTRDYRGRWHRPNGQYASKVEIAQAGLAW
ncbi:hypothetical protein [Weissella confusa]|uniref:hypothetical protein n=1 Tax=Weissella confusa TaxID=1583 RepID=UPI0021A76B6C|nr:hypothetical protein [Weissella confusa]MCT2911690.1 hypothetical protein [Weissella confusa]